MSGSLPACVQYVQAFGSPVLAVGVALAGFTIAYAQMQIAQERFRLDLAKERSAFIRSTLACVERLWKADFEEKWREFHENHHAYRPFFDLSFTLDAISIVNKAKEFNDRHIELMGSLNYTSDGRESAAFILQDMADAELQAIVQDWDKRALSYLAPISEPGWSLSELGLPALFVSGLFIVPGVTVLAMWCGG